MTCSFEVLSQLKLALKGLNFLSLSTASAIFVSSMGNLTDILLMLFPFYPTVMLVMFVYNLNVSLK